MTIQLMYIFYITNNQRAYITDENALLENNNLKRLEFIKY